MAVFFVWVVAFGAALVGFGFARRLYRHRLPFKRLEFKRGLR